MSLRFEWNERKAKANYEKHGVSFEWAERLFQDPFAVEFLDDREDYGEERFVIVGMVERQILCAAYAERKEVIRIISVRRATTHEREIYLEENS